MRVKVALPPKREFLSPLGWSGLTFGAAKQGRKAGTNIEQASPSGAAGAGRTEVRAGDKGLSGSGTAVTKHICPYNLDADDGESVGFMESSGCGTE